MVSSDPLESEVRTYLAALSSELQIRVTSRIGLTARQPRCAKPPFMVDYFALAITHGLLALAAWRLIMRADLDRDPVADASEGGEATSPVSGQKPARRA